MKFPLRDCTIYLAGDFGPERTPSTMRRWINSAGGEVAGTIDANTTHLICSEHEWNAQGLKVKAAQKHKNIKIVKFDWLGDSLQARAPRSAKSYAFKPSGSVPAKGGKGESTKTKIPGRAPRATRGKGGVSQTASKSGSTARSRAGAAGRPASKPEPDDSTQGTLDQIKHTHHVYRSPAGFEYDIKIPHSKDEEGQEELQAGFTNLRILESNTPDIGSYLCISTYSVPERKPVELLLAPQGSSFDLARNMFIAMFKHKAEKEWAEPVIDPAGVGMA